MKRFVIALMMFIPMLTFAQDNAWEQTNTSLKPNRNPKYLAGAVPEVDGKVVFSKTIQAPGKTKEQIYNIILTEFYSMTQESNQFEQSRVVLADSINHNQIVGNYQEWLVFKNKPLILDRTRFFYHLIANIKDGEATIQMTRIYYLYDEERIPTTFKAEEWINDRYGLNNKKTKTSRVSGKFRIKTIDRKDFIFNKLETLLTK